MSEKTNIVDTTELGAAEQEAAETPVENVGRYVHNFVNPFSYEGKTYEKLTFDWAKLTAKDSLAIENEMMSLGKPLVAPEFSGEYLIRMAVRACEEKVAINVLQAIPLGDYNKIRARARTFLLRSGS